MKKLETASSKIPAILAFAVLLQMLPFALPGGGSTASAQPRNKKLFDAYKSAAVVLYEQQKYEEAIGQFEKAFETIPDPKIWFNLGQCHRLLNHYEQALLYYEKFLEALPKIQDLPESKKAAVAQEVRQWVDGLKKEKKAEDERIRKEAEEKQRLERERLEKDSPDGVKTDAGTAAPGTEPVVAGSGGLTTKWWFWTGVGATVVLTAVTVWAGTQALSYNDAWKKDWDPADRDSARTFMNITDVSLAGAVIAGVAVSVATVLHLKAPPARVEGKTAPVALLPSCDGSGCYLSFTLDF
ncbi:tetratricopeptide repeat protein [Myxococcota bacterium]|nr:tetratricopeptide repeat protein [Myxococcota bacterium]MBU1511746.1 tetratricopeptide repeat protein [Myxococcota bacterium]